MLQLIFRAATAVITIYTVMCFVRIIITWVPSFQYSAIGRFLSAMCDPYLTLFSKLPLRLGMLDFSPVVAIGVLTLLSSLLSSTATTGYIRIGYILASVVSLLWSVVQSLLSVLLLVILVRFIVECVTKGNLPYNSVWRALDGALSPIIYKIINLVKAGGDTPYKKALGAALIILGLMFIVGLILIKIICTLLVLIPI